MADAWVLAREGCWHLDLCIFDGVVFLCFFLFLDLASDLFIHRPYTHRIIPIIQKIDNPVFVILCDCGKIRSLAEKNQRNFVLGKKPAKPTSSFTLVPPFDLCPSFLYIFYH